MNSFFFEDKMEDTNFCHKLANSLYKIDDMQELIGTAGIKLCDDEFKIFIDKCTNLDYIDKDGNTILHYICEYGTLNMLQYFIDRVDVVGVNRYNLLGYQPIDVINWSGVEPLEMVKVLVAHGADIKMFSIKGLYYSTYIGDDALVLIKYLVENGADVNYVDNANGWRPLHSACVGGCIEIVKFFIKNGADVNCVDVSGWRPIHYAVDNLEIIKILIENGANVNVRTNCGNLPSDLTENWKIRELLCKN